MDSVVSPLAQPFPQFVRPHALLVPLHDDVPGAQRVQHGRDGEVRVVFGDHVVAGVCNDGESRNREVG